MAIEPLVAAHSLGARAVVSEFIRIRKEVINRMNHIPP